MADVSKSNQQTPRKSVDWVEGFVKWTRYDYVAMYDYPTTQNSDVIMEIYKGDMLQLSRRYRRGDWCLVQVGHVLGWVFLQDVRFMVRAGKAPRPKTKPSQRPKPEVDPHRAVTMPNRNTLPLAEEYWDTEVADTSPTQAPQQILKPGTGELPKLDENYQKVVPQATEEKQAKKNMLKRLIGFFSK